MGVTVGRKVWAMECRYNGSEDEFALVSTYPGYHADHCGISLRLDEPQLPTPIGSGDPDAGEGRRAGRMRLAAEAIKAKSEAHIVMLDVGLHDLSLFCLKVKPYL
jgi:hypothetical protein